MIDSIWAARSGLGDQRRVDAISVEKGEWRSGSHGGSSALAWWGDGAASGVGQQECLGS